MFIILFILIVCFSPGFFLNQCSSSFSWMDYVKEISRLLLSQNENSLMIFLLNDLNALLKHTHKFLKLNKIHSLPFFHKNMKYPPISTDQLIYNIMPLALCCHPPLNSKAFVTNLWCSLKILVESVFFFSPATDF